MQAFPVGAEIRSPEVHTPSHRSPVNREVFNFVGSSQHTTEGASTRSFVGLDPWGLDPGAWKKPKLSKSEVNLKKVEKIHEKSKPVCEQSNR